MTEINEDVYITSPQCKSTASCLPGSDSCERDRTACVSPSLNRLCVPPFRMAVYNELKSEQFKHLHVTVGLGFCIYLNSFPGP